MSKKQTSQAFLAAATTGDLREEVRIARPAAQELLIDHGIDGDHLDFIAELVGSPFDFKSNGSNIWGQYCTHISAAFALGIAIGQLVSPDVFKTGGAK